MGQSVSEAIIINILKLKNIVLDGRGSERLFPVNQNYYFRFKQKMFKIEL